jgi:hypothetical protein
LPSQATSAGSDPTGDLALPTTGLAALSSDSREFCWPKDDLPKRLPNVQILLYGYEADVIGPFQAKSQNTITTHGNNFLIALERKLPKNIPVIFVAHSLGGILVKDVCTIWIEGDGAVLTVTVRFFRYRSRTLSINTDRSTAIHAGSCSWVRPIEAPG